MSTNQNGLSHKKSLIKAKKTKFQTRIDELFNNYFRIPTALLITILVFFLTAFSEKHFLGGSEAEQPEGQRRMIGKNVAQEEACSELETWTSSLFCILNNSKILSSLDKFSIFFLAVLFILETPDRRKQSYRQAWMLIDLARDCETSGARRMALEELHQAKQSLRGLDANKADLEDIDFSGAELSKASFKESLLKGANFQNSKLGSVDFNRAKLENSSFQGAHLQYAKFYAAILEKANFEGANLGASDLQLSFLLNANMQKVNLNGANLARADLTMVDFRGASLEFTNCQFADFYKSNLYGANIANADLRCVKNLELSQVKSAKNWELAIYDELFYPEELNLKRSPAPSNQAVVNLDSREIKIEFARRKLSKYLTQCILVHEQSNVISQIVELPDEEMLEKLQNQELTKFFNNLVSEVISEESQKREALKILTDLEADIARLKEMDGQSGRY